MIKSVTHSIIFIKVARLISLTDRIIRIQWKLKASTRVSMADYRHENSRPSNSEQLRTSDRMKKKLMANGVLRARRGWSGGEGRDTVAPPSIDNYSFKRVARRGQISILKRRPERRPGEKCPVPKRYEISGVVSPFVVVHSPPAQEERQRRGWRVGSGGLNVCTSGAPAER